MERDGPIPGIEGRLNRDNALFTVIGLLGGFLAGYVLHEQISAVQPARRLAGSGAAVQTAGPAPAPSAAPAQMEMERLRARLEADPNDAVAILQLANLNFDIQNWARARELYERHLRLQPGNPDVLTDLGICLRAQGDFQGALARFHEAQGLGPAHWHSRFNEVVVLAFDLKDFAQAERKLADLERLAPGDANVARLAAELQKLRDAS